MATFGIVQADTLSRIRDSREAILDGRLADARRSDERKGLTITAPRFQPRHIFGIASIDRDCGGYRRQVLRLLPVVIGIDGQIGLGQDDQRQSSARRADCQIPFKTRRIEIGVAAGDDSQSVDIGRNDLAFGFLTRRATTDRGEWVKPSLDRRVFVHDPVADRKAAGFIMADERQGTFGRDRLEPVAVNGADPRRSFAVSNLTGEVGRPSEAGKNVFCQREVPFENL